MIALAVGIGCLAVLVTAARLRPSPKGIGTHTGMRLRECQFERTTGLPCPTCGMTTSFSYFVRGNLAASFYVQPMGMVLALLSSMAVWAALYIAITGRPAHRLLRFVAPRSYVVPLLCLTILAWGWKIFIHVTYRDGWGR
jgi:hypothetical protein